MAATSVVDDRAFERMYRRYLPDVYRFALALLRNPADAEDVTQTTFMNAYRALQAGERPRRPSSWLLTIAHNAARSRVRRAMRRPREVPLDDVVTQLAVPESERTNIRELLRALGRLPFNQRTAITMRELEGRSYPEIAETLGVTVPAVEALLARARRALRMQANAIRGLTLVGVPRSLRKLFENGEAVTGGAVGAGALAKVAAVIVAAGVTAGAGFPTDAGGPQASAAAQGAWPRAAYVLVPQSQPPASRSARRSAAPSRVQGRNVRSRVIHRIGALPVADVGAQAAAPAVHATAPAPSSPAAPAVAPHANPATAAVAAGAATTTAAAATTTAAAVTTTAAAVTTTAAAVTTTAAAAAKTVGDTVGSTATAVGNSVGNTAQAAGSAVKQVTTTAAAAAEQPVSAAAQVVDQIVTTATNALPPPPVTAPSVPPLPSGPPPAPTVSTPSSLPKIPGTKLP